jgi:hypothetical protein
MHQSVNNLLVNGVTYDAVRFKRTPVKADIVLLGSTYLLLRLHS